MIKKKLAAAIGALMLACQAAPVLAAEKVPQVRANKQMPVGTLYLLCEYDGEDLVVNWTAKPNLPDTLLSLVSGTLRFGTGATLYIGGVPEGVAVRGLPFSGGQEILTVGPGLNSLDAWVSASADMITVGLPPHSGTTPTVQVDCKQI